MKIVKAHLRIDTREQRPYMFTDCTSRHVEFSIERAGLPTGDYAAALGADAPPAEQIIVERKSHSDFLGSIGHGRERLEAEIERAAGYGWFGIVIESGFIDLVQRPGGLHPSGIVGTICAFMQRRGVHIVFAGNRKYAERLTWRLCERWVRDRALAENGVTA